MNRDRFLKILPSAIRFQRPTDSERLEPPLICLPLSAATPGGLRDWLVAHPQSEELTFRHWGDQIQIYSEAMRFNVVLPVTAFKLKGFRAWSVSREFPERGRISFVDKELLIDMSPEEIETHIKVKTAISRAIENFVEENDLGEFIGEGLQVTNAKAHLSNEPDGTFVSWESEDEGRVRLTPRKNEDGQYMEVDGSPDWVLEVVSNNSVRKDRVEMRGRYRRAKIREYWIVDARGEDIRFDLLVLQGNRYVSVPFRNGWYRSAVFGRGVRLDRRRNRKGRWQYRLEISAE